MSLQQQVVNFPNHQLSGDLLEKVILGNDLSGLSSSQKVEYVKGLCRSTGLNPATKPIQLIKFQGGKEVPYFTKDASEQLRKINGVSITNVDIKVLDGGLYVVTVYATDKTGRQDSSTAAIVIGGLKGDALANAMMKCETKAKRRVTLSICGLGFIDELEAETLPQAQKVDINELEKPKVELTKMDPFMLEVHLAEVDKCKDLLELRNVFEQLKKKFSRSHPEEFQQIIDAKDIRKEELSQIIDVDQDTGEIFQ